jgi:regulator of nonsense transcripts 2
MASKDIDKEREKEDKERLAKQRPVLRIIAELALVGAWAEGPVKGAGEVGRILKALVSCFTDAATGANTSQMTGDPQFTNLPLLATFLKHFNRPYLGHQAEASGDVDSQQAVSTLPNGVDELIPVDMQAKLREMFVGYFQSASKTLVKGQIVSHIEDPRSGSS